MSSVITFLLAFCMILLVECQNANDRCSIDMDDTLEKVEWKTMHSNCTLEVKDQIKMEYNAAMIYLSLGVHFSRDFVNRPGFAKFFFESASEERQHAIKLIEYLSMRGESVTDIAKLVKLDPETMPGMASVSLNGKEALEKALQQEVLVTNNILKVMKACENEEVKDAAWTLPNDYHLVDWLTAEFLDEQYKGQRDIAGKLSTLLKMGSSNYHLGEFLFDKKLLSNEA
ncbi:ferritin subunit [Nilaparvata lugens]|uniref:Ferritin n=1 Tax=Nilaparvata lugens TaxID=108931 RepID=Q9U0S2_NILLU